MLTAFTGWSSERCPGIGFLSRGDREIGVLRNVEPPTRPRLECLRETGLILRCDRKVGNPFQTKQGSRPSCPDQEGRKGSEEGVPENLSVPLEGDRDFGELCGSHQGCQVPFRPPIPNVGLLLRRCSGKGLHLAMTGEPRGFSRVTAGFSSYDGEFRLPLVLAQAAIDTAREALNRARRESEDNQYSEEEELYAAGRAVETAQAALEDARRQAEVLQKEGEIDRITCESERSDKEKSRAALQEILDNGGRLLAPAPGTVVRTLERGDKTKEGEDAVILSSADRGFVFEGKLDKDSARHFSAGDKGELHYGLDGSSQKADVEIHSISPQDESDQVLVTAVLPEGGYTSGMPAQLFLSRKSETYQNCLPLTALRSDFGGDHVFVLRRQSSVLGTEWVIARVDITVKERDSQMMYVDGALTYSDQVVISSNKIISEGDRVRIEN